MPEFTCWREIDAPTISFDIWVGTTSPNVGRSAARRIAQRYCDQVGLCVTLTDTDFVFTGGTECGVRVGIRNYPRFPSDQETLRLHAEALGYRLAEALHQGSFMVEGPKMTRWYTRRPRDA